MLTTSGLAGDRHAWGAHLPGEKERDDEPKAPVRCGIRPFDPVLPAERLSDRLLANFDYPTDARIKEYRRLRHRADAWRESLPSLRRGHKRRRAQLSELARRHLSIAE